MDYSKTQTARYNIHAPAVTRDMGTKVQSVTI